jgi:ABC-type lipoprotein release transport system permease subunit
MQAVGRIVPVMPVALVSQVFIRHPESSLSELDIKAAVGALLFDMLLLSRGLLVSFRGLLDSVGYDIRVMYTDAAPMGGPRLPNASTIARELAALPQIDEAVPIRIVEGEALPAASDAGAATAAQGRRRTIGFGLMGIGEGRRRPWTLSAGTDLDAAGSNAASESMLINRRLADELRVSLGDVVAVRATCVPDRAALPPRSFRVQGLAEFPFDDGAQLTGVMSRGSLARLCGSDVDEADMLFVASREGQGADAAVSAIRRRRPDLHPATNEEIVARMQQTSFSYFRQISTVLSTITLLFGFLLITVLLTVSVNQRLAEIAAIRALGFSRSRVAADVLWQSVLLVGAGGALAMPLGLALSIWLDAILKKMPGIPASLHFFVFEPRALVVHVTLLAVTAILAAVYPMRLVATLPIAATLRNEVVS